LQASSCVLELSSLAIEFRLPILPFPQPCCTADSRANNNFEAALSPIQTMLQMPAQAHPRERPEAPQFAMEMRDVTAGISRLFLP
jgi:hypothetical protein